MNFAELRRLISSEEPLLAPTRLQESEKMSDIVIHGFSFSPYTRSVAMALELKGLPYRNQWIDLRPVEGGLGSVEHRDLHPFARAPID